MRRKVIYITILIIALLVCLAIFLAPKHTHRILIIQSYEPTCKTAQTLTSQIIKDLKDKGIQPDVRCCYLDCESFLDISEVSWMNHLLDSVSADGWKPEVILVNEDQGTYSLLKTGHKLTRNTPIVFAGVNFPNWAQLKNFHNVTGFQDSIDVLANLVFIKRFRRSSQGLYTVLDSTFIDMKIRDEINEVSKEIKLVGFMTPEIPFKVQRKLVERHGYLMLEDFPTRGKASRTAELLWNISYFGRDKSYLNLKRDFTTINIGRLNANYSFTAIKEEFGFGNNLLAGYFTPLKTQAADQVDYAVKILNGTPVSKLPIKKSEKKYMVDGTVMQSHHLSIDDFPANCEYIHLSIKEKHPTLFASMFAFIGLLFVISIVYLVLLYRRERKRKKAAYNTVMREREVLKLALEGSNTFVWSLRENLLTFDDSFCKYMGLPSLPIPLEKIRLYIHPSIRRKYYAFLADKSSRKGMELLAAVDGKNYQWWNVHCSSTFMLDGKVSVLGVLFNVQEYKDKEEELKRARILAEKAEMKQSFFANMSHEIRTPLNAIIGFTDILVDSENLPKVERMKYIQIVKKNSKELLDMVNEVLTLTDIDSGTMMFHSQEEKASDVLEKVYLNYLPEMPLNLQLVKQEGEEDLCVNTDINHLSDILVHLLDNAAKFTEKGKVTLGYRYVPDSKEVEFYVEDTGRGIPEDELEMVFSRFYKRDVFASGVGLGLSVCKVIADKLHGRLTVHSKEGEGSLFSFFLHCDYTPK